MQHMLFRLLTFLRPLPVGREARVARGRYEKEGGKGRMHEEERAVMEVKGEEWETNGTGGVRTKQPLEESWEEALEQRAR